MPLTATAIRNAKPGKKPQRLHDAGGLYLEVAAAGGRWWRFAYRFGGKRKLISLGVFPAVSLADARDRRDDARKLLAGGVDPSAKRKAVKREAEGRSANSFEAVAREWYVKQAKVWVPHHASDVLRRLEANLFPDLGKRPIAEITAPGLLAAVRKIEYRGAHDLAHRVLQVASQVRETAGLVPAQRDSSTLWPASVTHTTWRDWLPLTPVLQSPLHAPHSATRQLAAEVDAPPVAGASRCTSNT